MDFQKYNFLFLILLMICIVSITSSTKKKKKKTHDQWKSKIARLEKNFAYRDDVTDVESVTPGNESKDTDFPNLLSLLGSETETGHQYKLFGCVINVDKAKCNITFLPEKESCQEKLSLSRLFNFVFKKTKLRNITKNYIPLENFQIKIFFLNRCEGDVMFTTFAKEPFDIVKNKLQVLKGELTMEFNYKELQESPTFNGIGLDLKGEVKIVNTKAPLTLVKKLGSEEGKFSIKLDSISASDFGKLFSKKEVTENSAPEETGMFTNAVLNKPTVTGSRDANGAYEIILKGEASGIEGIGPFMLFVIVQKLSTEPVSVAIVADIKQINPTKVLSALTGKDLTNIPLIKHITVNIAVEFANRDIMVLKDEEINKLLAKYVANAKTVTKGTKIKLDIPIKKILQDTGTVASLSHVPRNMFVQMFLHEGKVCFRFPENATMDLLNILVALVPKVPDVLFNHILKKPPPVIIKKFDVDVTTKEVDLKLETPREVVLGDNLITLKAAEFELSHKPDSEWNFKVRAEQSIGDAILNVLIEKKSHEYEFKGKISDLTTKELVEHFGAPKAQKTLERLSFLDFGIKDLEISAKFGEKLRLHIKGQPVLFGFEDIFFEGYIFDMDKDDRFDVDEENKRSKNTRAVKKQAIQPDNPSNLTTSDLEFENIATTNKQQHLTTTTSNIATTTTSNNLPNKQSNNNNEDGEDDDDDKSKEIVVDDRLGNEDDKESDVIEKDDDEDTEVPEDEQLLKPKYDRKFAFGLVIRHVRIDEIIEKIFNKTILKNSWLTDLSLSLTVSNTDPTKDIKFTTPELKRVLKLKEGIFIDTMITIPKNCKGDSLCEIARDKMIPGTKIYLEGEISPMSMILRGGYRGGGLKLGKNLVLHKVHTVFEMNLGVGMEFYLEGDLQIKKPALTFRGRVAVGITGKVELRLTMIGMWKKPFGIPFIAFGNIGGAMAVFPGIPVPKIELTAEVWIGNIGNNRELKVKAAIGMSPVNPLSDYFFADINKLTIESLAQSFGWDLPLPRVITDSGFPEGLIVSFTLNPKGIDIEHLDTEIKMGFQFRGMIKFLGLKVRCEILVNFPKKISVQVDMLPVRIGRGLLKLQRSKDDSENGPQVYVGIGLTEVQVRAQAYAELLGIGAEVLIDISNKGIEFFIYGNLFNLLEANVTVSAPYGNGDLLESEFVVGACLSASIADITLNAKDTVSDVVENTEEAIQETNERAKHSGSWYDKATKKMNDWTESLEEKQAAIQRKSGKLDKIEDVLDDECVDECEDDEHCNKIFGHWVPCPDWDDCATMVENPLCLAGCKGEHLYLEGKALKKKVTIEILLDAIEIIQKILEYVKGFVERSKSLIDATEKAAQKVEDAAVKAKKAMYAVAKYTKENLIDIHHLCFNTTLEQAASACFGFSVNVTLGGRKNFNINTKACLDVSFIRNIGEAITEKVFPGIEKVKELLDNAQNHFKKADEKKEILEDFKKEEEKAEKELEGQIDEDAITEDETDDVEEDEMLKRKGEIHYPDQSRSAEYIKKQIYGDFSEVFIHDDLTMDAFAKKSPWSFSQRHSPFTRSKKVKKGFNDTEVIVNEQRSLDFDALEDPEDTSACEQSKRVLSTYSMISDTVKLITDKLKDEKVQYEAEAKRFVDNINFAEKDLIRKCDKANVTSGRTDQLMDLVERIKTGVSSWMKDTDAQIDIHDKHFLKLWRRSFTNIIKSNRNEDTAAFVRSLHEVSHNLIKRSTIPDHKRSEVEDRMKSASTIVKDLLVGKVAPLSSKYGAVQKLQRDIEILKKEMQVPCAA